MRYSELNVERLIHDVLAQRPTRDHSIKHRDRQFDHLLATSQFNTLDSSELSCIEYILRPALRSLTSRLNLCPVLPHRQQTAWTFGKVNFMTSCLTLHPESYLRDPQLPW